jgi:hypothetical protein
VEFKVSKGRYSGLKPFDNIVKKPNILIKVASLAGLATINIPIPDIIKIK